MPKVERRWLGVIIAVAVVLRLGAALYMGNRIEVLPGIHDQVSYDALARSILAGQGYSFERDWYPFTPAHTPTAHWSFLYPLYLAGVYALFGPHPLAARLIQGALSGALTAWLIYRLSRRLFSLPSPPPLGPPQLWGGSGEEGSPVPPSPRVGRGGLGGRGPHQSSASPSSNSLSPLMGNDKPLGSGEEGKRVGLVAAALSAVYIYFIYYDAALMTESFYTVGILAMLNLTLDISDADAASLTRRCRFAYTQIKEKVSVQGVDQKPGFWYSTSEAVLLAGAFPLPVGSLCTKNLVSWPPRERLQEKISVHQRLSASHWLWVLLGIVLGLTTLLRQSILPFVPFLFAWLYWATRNQQPVSRITHHASRFTFYVSRFTFHVSPMLCTLLILVAFIMPWAIRNYQVYGTFLPLNSNAGYALYSANHPDHGTHFMQAHAAPLPPELAGLNEAQLNNELMVQGFQFILQDPGRYLLLSLSRVPIYFKFWPSPESHPLSNVSRVLSFGLYLPFFLYGLYLSRRHWRRCSLLYLFGLVYSLMHILTWASIRYRLPVDAAFMPFAALAVVDLGGGWLE